MVACFSECFVRYTLLCCMWKDGLLGLTEAILCKTYWPGHSSASHEEQLSSPCSSKASGLADYRGLYLAR